MDDASVVEVFHPYRAQEKHQLTIAVGEKLTVIEKDPTGWWVGRNAKGVVGVFPSTYTKRATTLAPSAMVTREVVAARLLAELGISEDGATARAEKHDSNALHSVEKGFQIHMDLDYDDVYAMKNNELENELKRLVARREQQKRKFAEMLARVVDTSLAQRKSISNGVEADLPVDHLNLEQQRLRIGRKRLEELILAEQQLVDDMQELEQSLKLKRIPIPACIAAPQVSPFSTHGSADMMSNPSTPTAEASVPKVALVDAILLSPTANPPAASRSDPTMSSSATTAGVTGDPATSTSVDSADEWLAGVTDASLVPYLKHLQKQLMDVNEVLDKMEAKMEPLSAKMCALENEVDTRQEVLNKLAETHQQLVKELFEHWEQRVAAAQQEYSDLKSGGKNGPQLVAALKEQIAMLEKQLETGKRQYEKTRTDVESLKARWQQLEGMSALTTQTEVLHREIHTLSLKERELREEAVVIEAEGRKALQEDQVRYRKLERRRREIYNQIQELKGNLRVYCRIKPCGKNETSECVQVVDDMTVRITDPDLQQTNEYEFDFVIPEKATQEEIFEEVRPLATSVLDGYNVCIFAYGQTGSGKTYTMEGPPNNRGINFRAVRELFQIATERGEDYSSTMRVSIMEVYNDKLFDLQNKRSASRVRWAGDEQGVVIEPCVKHVVHSVDDVQAALEKAYQSRSVAGTDCNAHSSRSHCILTVFVDATNNATQQTISAKLHLIDLAGSERVKNSGVEGDRLKEATHINTSLTHLKTVIQGLANKSSFVAYRNSTLTSMLQDSLGGNCKCLMFANVSPAAHNVPESVCTMKYAAEARKVEVGKVSANVKKK